MQSRSSEETDKQHLALCLLAAPPWTNALAVVATGALVQAIIGFAISVFPPSALILTLAAVAYVCWKVAPPAYALLDDAFAAMRLRLRIIPTLLFAVISAFMASQTDFQLLFPGGSAKANDLDTKNRAAGDNHPQAAPDLARRDVARTEDLTHPGVILTPEEKPHVTLVPPMPALGKGVFRLEAEKPLTIPFYGVYHFFRRRDGALPSNSVQQRGTPDSLRFRSTDNSPLIMEAHQNLRTFIDVSCCAAVEVAISNADSYRWTVLMELILIDTERGQKQSLGVLPVNSAAARPDTSPVSETLSFSLQSAANLRRFDEITIRYHLNLLRAERSAKIAIDKLVLIPRGL